MWRGYIEIGCDGDRCRFHFGNSADTQEVATSLVEALRAQGTRLFWRTAQAMIFSESLLLLEDLDAANFPPTDEAVRIKWFHLVRAASDYMEAEAQAAEARMRNAEAEEDEEA